LHRQTRLIATAVGVAAALILAGCVTAPEPDPSPKPTKTEAAPRPTPSAPPAAEPVAAPDPAYTATDTTHLTVRPEFLELHAAGGALIQELSYDADAETFVATLTDALGGPPTVTETPRGHEWWASTKYSWPGVSVVDDHEEDGHQSDMNVAVTFTHPVVADGVSVSTVQGYRPGDDLRAFAAQLGERWYEADVAPFNDFPAETGPDIGPRGYDEWTDTYWDRANANSVAVSNWSGPGGTPTSGTMLRAPFNYGIGHV
jgi:hypothetical protein